MLLVMDESGDPGLATPPGQSPWFVVAGALFDTREDGQTCRAALAEFRRTHGGGELHFIENSVKRRRLVLEVLAGCPFRYFAVACDKSKLDPAGWRKPAGLRHELARRLIGSIAARLADCTVWFDTLGGRPVDREYGKVVQRAAGKLPTGKGRVKECQPRDSGKEVLVQLADYVCGAMARSVRGDDDYRRVIRGREGGVSVWPGEKESGPPERPASE